MIGYDPQSHTSPERQRRVARRGRSQSAHGFLAIALCALAGCRAADGVSSRARAIAAAARPILKLDPDSVWTDSYNRLIELSPDTVRYLAEHPRMTRRCAPDDLSVLLHASLLRLLIAPHDAPRLSMTCFETTLGVLHLEPKAAGRRIGTVHLAAGPLPRRWHDLYPADFDHRLTPHIDADLDRLALRQWWQRHKDRIESSVATAPLSPQARWLWPVLSRRYADQWRYSPESGVVLCADFFALAQSPQPTLIRAESKTYDLVRAACVLLGTRSDPAVQDRLIELVASRSDIVSHNARFALGFAADPRIRALLERHRSRNEHGDPKGDSSDEPETIRT